MDIFSDAWWGMVAVSAKNYTVTIGLVIGFVGSVFKTIAIRHPGILDNSVVTLWKSWIFGLPVIGKAIENEVKPETVEGQ